MYLSTVDKNINSQAINTYMSKVFMTWSILLLHTTINPPVRKLKRNWDHNQELYYCSRKQHKQIQKVNKYIMQENVKLGRKHKIIPLHFLPTSTKLVNIKVTHVCLKVTQTISTYHGIFFQHIYKTDKDQGHTCLSHGPKSYLNRISDRWFIKL